MTDQSLPGKQVAAALEARATRPWRPVGADWLPESRASGWGCYRGTLAVAALKASRVLFMKFDRPGTCSRVRVPASADDTTAGSAPSPTLPNGDLLVTTDNGGGNDKLLRVSPRPDNCHGDFVMPV